MAVITTPQELRQYLQQKSGLSAPELSAKLQPAPLDEVIYEPLDDWMDEPSEALFRTEEDEKLNVEEQDETPSPISPVPQVAVHCVFPPAARSHSPDMHTQKPFNLPASTGRRVPLVSRNLHRASGLPVARAYNLKRLQSIQKIKRCKQPVPSIYDLVLPMLMPNPRNEESFEHFLPEGLSLYPYQIQGVQKLLENPGFLLADDMGTGKTVMATIAMRVLFNQGLIHRALILCPAHLLDVWMDHLRTWSMGELQIVKIHGSKSFREKSWRIPYHVSVTSYDTFRNDCNENIIPANDDRFDLLIMDECQYLKNKNSKRFLNIQQIINTYRWGLSGTPLENKIDDIKNIYRILRRGTVLSHVNQWSQVRDAIAPYMIRRRKIDVLTNLPEKHRHILRLEMSEDQYEAYENQFTSAIDELLAMFESDDFLMRLSEGDKKQENEQRVSAMAQFMKLRRACNFPSEIDCEETCKGIALKNLVSSIVQIGEKVIIFSNFLGFGVHPIRYLLEDYSSNLLTYHGRMKKTKRAAVIEQFQTDPEKKILIASVKACGIGLTLTAANHIIHFDQDWNPAITLQAEDRVHRIGQTKPVHVYEFWVNDTVEERIFETMQHKKKMFETIVDANATQIDAFQPISTKDLYQLLFDIDLEKEKLKAVRALRLRNQWKEHIAANANLQA
ncbi:MAG: DEAD/DEAH box helicase [Anaerolineaceae bacterium]|nr:DEAD/DEAH box helicase [Anaerolineaceae bacterium]